MSCGQPPTSSPAAPDTTVAAAAPQLLLDLQGSGTKSTQTFTAAANWDLQWSYDCTAGLTSDGAIPTGYHCSFIVHTADVSGHLVPGILSVNQLGVKDQGVEHYHQGGTFYLEVQICCADSSWAVKVTG